MYEHDPYTLPTFNGLFARGSGEVCPIDHLQACQNLLFKHNQTLTRFGTSRVLDLPDIRRIWPYQRLGEIDRMLVLDGSGRLFSSLDLSTPILTIPGMTDFAAISFFNRAYISPHNGRRGLPGEKIYVYDGGADVRPAAGTPPGMAPVVATSAQSGTVQTGKRIVAIAFETVSGFITRSSDAVLYDTSTSKRKIDVSNIETGPDGTVARLILASKTILDYDANNFNPLNYELFFIPNSLGGRLGDNTSVATTVDFLDAQLVSSADYLLDELETLPAGVSLGEFTGSMLITTEDANPELIRVSKPGEPESFSAIDGFIKVRPGDAGGDVKNTASYRGSLYMFKGLRAYFTQNTSVSPSAWVPNSVDAGQGTGPLGVSRVLDSNGQTLDSFLVATQSGLIHFEGSFSVRELSWKIKDYWDRINPVAFDTVQVVIDPIKRWLYVAVPLDLDTACNTVFFGDFNNGLSPETIRWSIWKFPNGFPPTSIIVDTDFTTKISSFKFGSSSGGVYIYDETKRDDFGNAIEAFGETTNFPPDNNAGYIYHFGALRFRVKGNGSFDLEVADQDKAVVENPDSLTLSVAPGRELVRLINYETEGMSVKFGVDAFGEWFELTSVTAFGTMVWEARPQDD